MSILQKISDAIWGIPTVVLILGVGLVFTAALRFPQLFRLRDIITSPRSVDRKGGVSPFQALSTALAATVGTGSIIGVATAITLGGAGAIFWLWVSAFFGMAVAYAEGVLSIKYRRHAPREGGIWYALRDGLDAPKVAAVYAVFCVLASFGMGSMAQTNSAAMALGSEWRIPPAVCGIACAVLLVFCLFHGGFAGRLCEKLIPLLAGLYVIGALAIIVKNHAALPDVFKNIFTSAFGIRPAAGGIAGYSVKTVISVGCRRGVFSNEAGLGTTASVHAASETDDPDRQGLMNMLEVIIDTFVICTLTALAILCAGAESTGLQGAEMVTRCAESVFGDAAGKVVAVSIAGFSLATAVGWSQIGSHAAKYVFPKAQSAYKMLFLASAFLGTLLSLDAVWQLSDIFNGLMVIPCMTALILLSKDVLSAKTPKTKSFD